MRELTCLLIATLFSLQPAYAFHSLGAQRSTRLSLSNVPAETIPLATDYELRFSGVGRIYHDGKDPLGLTNTLERFQQATVAVVGLGGVGSWAAEALCRSGVGNLVLIDLDDVCISNTNRQLHALSSTVGQMKIDAMQQRLLEINPDCNITLVHDFVSRDNVHDILKEFPLTVLLDAIDGSDGKAALLAACTDMRIPVVTCGGAAGRRDPTCIVCADITRVDGDKLLSTCRSKLRSYHGFKAGLSSSQQRKTGKRVKKWNIQCIYSTEPQKSVPAQSSKTSSLRRCDGALGTACFLTGTFGFAMAARVVDMIAEDRLKPPRR